ncbi:MULTISPECIES: hypothetical protein [unclassified Bradyrhizobium]|uniref:hypothetical protein n=1 Tax=unclassified Bradyrhizobium TaxID=2631580 RepID=UPI002478B848|nr:MULTISPECIES: hypothetical protein [unclassified Bradyrhizobium]WGR73809.1 hypothetical protein MTX24_13785 [Bradyrhizobium sp. ISRA426]WGR78646.1 hypothetical protein MTX21_38755 [Bradyrhizobium sp. ISRA430]WGR89048.1 hypothetical protein MTX25_13800 [Bradyrhizobium sp. ISRA432]
MSFAAVHIHEGFVLALLLKMGLSALIAVSVTVLAEKAGPVVGALLATLPVTSGPAFFFLAQDHDAAFISQTALSTFAQNIPTAIFATSYVLLAQRLSTTISVGGAMCVWLVYLALSLWGDSGLPTALLLGACVFPLCIVLVRPYRHATASAPGQHASDLIVRGVAVAVLVGAIEVLGLVAKPMWTGVLAAAPVLYLSLMIILQRRLGGRAAAAVIANSLAGFLGISLAFVTVYLLAVPLGKWTALAFGLTFSASWNTGLFLLHCRGASVLQSNSNHLLPIEANRISS